MQPHNIISLVKQCRSKQKEYFRTRDGAVLSEALSLEIRVDKAIEEWEGGQRRLFPRDAASPGRDQNRGTAK